MPSKWLFLATILAVFDQQGAKTHPNDQSLDRSASQTVWVPEYFVFPAALLVGYHDLPFLDFVEFGVNLSIKSCGCFSGGNHGSFDNLVYS